MELASEKKIVDVNGIKLEIDMRHARVIENYRIGDIVKVLKKRWSSGDSWESFSGTIVGFDAFEVRPTIIIAYIASSNLEFCYINSDSKDIEICMANDLDLSFSKEQVLTLMSNDISRKQREIEDIEQKRDAFLKLFGKYFEPKEQKNIA